ncbi:MAG: hypothetical protein WB502_03695 [Thermoactinomyces sp.]
MDTSDQKLPALRQSLQCASESVVKKLHGSNSTYRTDGTPFPNKNPVPEIVHI